MNMKMNVYKDGKEVARCVDCSIHTSIVNNTKLTTISTGPLLFLDNSSYPDTSGFFEIRCFGEKNYVFKKATVNALKECIQVNDDRAWMAEFLLIE